MFKSRWCNASYSVAELQAPLSRVAALRPIPPGSSDSYDAGAHHITKVLIDVYGIGAIDDRSLRGMHVLDFGCDVAHSLALAQRGADVTCVDMHAVRLEHSRRAAELAWNAKQRRGDGGSMRFILSATANLSVGAHWYELVHSALV